jgi:hypothetical protein
MFAAWLQDSRTAAPVSFGDATSKAKAAEFAKLLGIPSSRICARVDRLFLVYA